MPLLSRFLSGGYKYAESTLGDNGPVATEEEEGLEARLIDYELLVDADGKRTVAFGWFAGVAGALESLYAMADMHLKGGVASPFLVSFSPFSTTYVSKVAVRIILSSFSIRLVRTLHHHSRPFVLLCDGSPAKSQNTAPHGPLVLV